MAGQPHVEESMQNPSHNDDMGSGCLTPQPQSADLSPEFTDKRFPSIIPSYFAPQVRGGSPLSTTATQEHDPTAHSQVDAEAKASSDTASLSGSIVMLERDQCSDPVPSQSEKRSDQRGMEEAPSDVNSLPTPPLSSSCSILQKEPEEAENGAPIVEKGMGSICRAIKNLLSQNAPKLGRHTSDPAVSRISSDPVLASHFSNPPSPPILPPSNNSCPLSDRSEELAKLTADEPRKNTPPLTPRAMSSNETPQAEKPARSPAHSHLESSKPSEHVSQSKPNHTTGVTEGQGIPVGSLKGKLSVKITEGRGLRPSYDPYVVCVFELNEYISKGAQTEEPNDTETKKGNNDTLSSVPIQRSNSDSGRPMAIPMKSRQSSKNSLLNGKGANEITDPLWNHEAVFDVLGDESEIDVSVYDRSDHEVFLGHVRLSLSFKEDNKSIEGWYPLASRGRGDGQVSGEIHLEMSFQKTDKKQFGPNDFQILKLIGKGTFGQVYQVKKKDTQRIYAMKVLSKKVIIQKKEVAHTLGERNILVRTAMTNSPFIVGLKFSFQTPTDLYLVTDYMSGGELFWHLQKEGRFQEARAKFYIAELILALQHLHEHDIVYRDLKPENILLDANGHIALCDFGLSKANLTKNQTTNTFCGTTEYLAPEVLLDEQGYTKMVDFWSLGVLVFEMCCGWSPFYAEDTQQMYKNIAFGKVRFPRDALSTEGRNFVKGLLNRNPKHRLGATDDAKELMAHPFFHDVDWEALGRKNVVPPFKPKLKSVMDTSYFDPEFTTALDQATSLNARAAALAAGVNPASTPLSPGMQANFRGFTFVNESSMDQHMKDVHMEDGSKPDDTWVKQSQPVASGRGDHRMSGVVKTTSETSEGGIFDDHLDM
ncbi:AGC/AKT protein kinase [Helicocarpus griseus UAMH5409]|uniref:non-specific serine/threonine protein kinase n=1 Tax=Helicocarpus griseus UAMH5409 TaxID=1447875 RepID=A0A2B7XD15_9EURO|nr:AGC/AKT protein kinase [Helicocarpus griseus UAMH5409]